MRSPRASSFAYLSQSSTQSPLRCLLSGLQNRWPSGSSLAFCLTPSARPVGVKMSFCCSLTSRLDAAPGILAYVAMSCARKARHTMCIRMRCLRRFLLPGQGVNLLTSFSIGAADLANSVTQLGTTAERRLVTYAEVGIPSVHAKPPGPCVSVHCSNCSRIGRTCYSRLAPQRKQVAMSRLPLASATLPG